MHKKSLDIQIVAWAYCPPEGPPPKAVNKLPNYPNQIQIALNSSKNGFIYLFSLEI